MQNKLRDVEGASLSMTEDPARRSYRITARVGATRETYREFSVDFDAGRYMHNSVEFVNELIERVMYLRGMLLGPPRPAFRIATRSSRRLQCVAK